MTNEKKVFQENLKKYGVKFHSIDAVQDSEYIYTWEDIGDDVLNMGPKNDFEDCYVKTFSYNNIQSEVESIEILINSENANLFAA